MAVDPEIRAMMRQVIRVGSPSAKTAYGDSMLGDNTPVRAYVQKRNNIVHTADGGELLSDVQIITESPIAVHDVVWLPDADPLDDRQARQVKAVAPMTDERGGVSHYEVSL
jgi:hypothetical protein